MIKHKIMMAGLFLLLTGCQYVGINTSLTAMPDNACLQGRENITVILCHGRGQYPDWMVVNPLRKAINQQLGYHTLSIQMPVAEISWREYLKLFKDAHQRIRLSIAALKQQGVKIYLMGHSMGSRMATSFLAKNPDAGIAGFIGVGIRGHGEGDLDSNENLRSVDIPVLDVFGDASVRDVRHARECEKYIAENYQQIVIPGGDHQFNDAAAEKLMVDAVLFWLINQG